MAAKKTCAGKVFTYFKLDVDVAEILNRIESFNACVVKEMAAAEEVVGAKKTTIQLLELLTYGPDCFRTALYIKGVLFGQSGDLVKLVTVGLSM